MNPINLKTGHATPEEIERMQSIEKELKQNPNDLTALLHKAILLFEPFHQEDEGEKVFNLINQKDPSFVDAYFWHAECIFSLTANFPLAEKHRDKCL